MMNGYSVTFSPRALRSRIARITEPSDGVPPNEGLPSGAETLSAVARVCPATDHT